MNFESETSEFKESLNKSCIFPKSQFPHCEKWSNKASFYRITKIKTQRDEERRQLRNYFSWYLVML